MADQNLYFEGSMNMGVLADGLIAHVSIESDAPSFATVDNSKTIPIATLVEGIDRARQLLNRIEKDTAMVKEILVGIEGADTDRLAAVMHQVSTGGSLKNLSGRIVQLLRDAGGPLTSGEIADKLYRSSTGLSEDAFRRRVIVQVSAMSKRDRSVVPAYEVGPGKEKHWTLPDPNEAPEMRAVLFHE